MKKLLYLTLFIVLLFAVFISFDKSVYYKVIKIDSPVRIFIDLNKNFIFDEKTPFEIDKIYFIEHSKDYSNDNILKNLSEEQKYFLEYMASDFSSKNLRNKFVKIKNNKIYINNKNYNDILLSSKYFYDETDASKQSLLNNINSINLDDYVILNKKNKKIHKLTCSYGRAIKNTAIIKIKKSDITFKKAKCCFNETDETKKQEEKIKKTLPSQFYYKNISIFFYDLNSTFKPDSKCSELGCIALKNEINNAKKNIDFAIYGFNNEPEIYNALKAAKNRGVKIRFVCNYDNNNNKYYPDIEKLKKLIPEFKTNKLERNEKAYSLMHNKFFIFDNTKVFTGSSNISTTDLSGFNANYSVLINSKEAAKIYTEEFNQMFSGKFNINKNKKAPETIELVSDIKIKILFSPQDSIIDNHIINLINNAKNYIYIPSFFITHKEFADALIAANNRGVEIKVITDATSAHSKYTLYKKLREFGIKVKTENYAGKMHMKSIFIDDRFSVIGSMNYTLSGTNKNDENVLIIENKNITKYLKSTFLHLWNKIPKKYETFDPKAESTESIGSCYDGIDNDFDNKIDKEDEGCLITR